MPAGVLCVLGGFSQRSLRLKIWAAAQENLKSQSSQRSAAENANEKHGTIEAMFQQTFSASSADFLGGLCALRFLAAAQENPKSRSSQRKAAENAEEKHGTIEAMRQQAFSASSADFLRDLCALRFAAAAQENLKSQSSQRKAAENAENKPELRSEGLLSLPSPLHLGRDTTRPSCGGLLRNLSWERNRDVWWHARCPPANA